MLNSVDEIIDKSIFPNKLNLKYKGVEFTARIFLSKFEQSFFEEITTDYVDVFENLPKGEKDSLKLLLTIFLELNGNPLLNPDPKFRLIRLGTREFSYSMLGKYKNAKHGTFFNTKFSSLDGKKRYKEIIDRSIREDKKTNTTIQERFNRAIYDEPLMDNPDLNSKLEVIFKDIIDLRTKITKAWKNATKKQQKDSKWIQKNIIEPKGKVYMKWKKEITKPEFQSLFHKIEEHFFSIWQTIFSRIEVRLNVKYSLTKQELKIYELMYFKQDLIDSHIPVFEPIFEEFSHTLTKNEIIELLKLIFFATDGPDSEHLLNTYKEKFERFLKFYPLWLKLVRNDENITKENKRIILRMMFLERKKERNEGLETLVNNL